MNALEMPKLFENPGSSQANKGFGDLTYYVKTEEQSKFP